MHKHKQQTPQGNPGTGQIENPAPAGVAIAGVVFKIQKLDLDLTQDTGWMTLKNLTVDQAKTRVVMGSETIKTTDDNGEATFDGLAVGAYLVTETNAPDNVVKKAAPFIVTVPHPNGNNTWNYNVHVYPKNTVSAKPTKTLDHTNAIKLGDSVTWTITQVLPELQNGETFTEVSFTDQLAEKLDYVETTAQVDGMEVGVTVTATGDGNRTLEGQLEDTATLTGGETVTFKITTTVNDPGKIVNTAKVRITTSDGGDTTQSTPDPGQGGGPGGAPTIFFGYFDIQKYVTGTTTAISGATFELYKDETCTTKVDLQEMLITVESGKLVSPIAVKAGTYSIKEIKAPTGYVLNTMCFPVTVGEDNTLTNPATVTVYNSKVTVPALPLTGAQGQNRVAGSETTQTTDDNGEATFDGLDVGAYLVTETQAPAGVVKKAAPFIVTIPHPNGNNTWNYNVHVYPKNTVSAKPTKTLDDTNAIKLGDSVTWTITQVLPELQNGETFTEVSFTDQLAEKLGYVETTAQVNGMEVDVTITSTGDGGRNLAGQLDDTTTLTGGETVTFKITTKVNKPGKIVNTAKVRIKTSDGGDTTQQTPTDPGGGPGGGPGGAPTLIYGYFDIQKYVTNTMIAISGATFELYTGDTCTNKVDLQETLITVDTGKLVSPFAVKAGTYSIKEIKAPTGYVLNDTCTQVTVGEDNTLANPATVTVYNSKVTVPALPLTGAQGQTIMLTTGGILIATGLITVAIVHRKRKLTANKNNMQH
ncbi:SpaH/EbpB family LPXTG-anchored major pilin [Canibacter sp. lx-45]|nr:SpaH/EbpB family LPXTG-anchored major pilin [Canibacter zhuwentaonis]